jgi:SAM-dependent methyltransferase
MSDNTIFTACALCGTDDFNKFWKKKFIMGVCRQCGLVYMNPVDWSKLNNLYRNQYNYGKTGFERFPTPSLWDRDRHDWIVSFFKPTDNKRRLVDIGCGAGKLLATFENRNWDCTGVEPDKISARYAQNSRGLNIQNCFLIQAKFDNNIFDAVVLASTFEHFQNPNTELKTIARILKPDGKLFLEVPNIEHLHGFYIDFAYSSGFTPTLEHLYCYSFKSLRAMLAKNGYRVISKEDIRENMRVVAVLDNTIEARKLPTDNPDAIHSMLMAYKMYNHLRWPIDVMIRLIEISIIYFFPKKMVEFLRSLRQNFEKRKKMK